MLSEYNQQALATAYASGWLTDEQYHAAVAGLEAMPHLSAPDFLHEQAILSAGQAEGRARRADELDCPVAIFTVS